MRSGDERQSPWIYHGVHGTSDLYGDDLGGGIYALEYSAEIQSGQQSGSVWIYESCLRGGAVGADPQ